MPNPQIGLQCLTKQRSEEKQFLPSRASLMDLEKQLSDLGLPSSFGGKASTTTKRKKVIFDDAGNKQSEQEIEVMQIQQINLSDEFKPITRNGLKNKLKSSSSSSATVTTINSNQEHSLDPSIEKYYAQRYRLFSRFDEGIRLDVESWFSVTPEKIALHIANRCSHCPLILDPFCGAGGNAIQFALKSQRVIAVDIDAEKIEIARHNAKIYGVSHKIDFIQGDAMQLMHHLKADAVFLSPPWGGPEYLSLETYDMRKMGSLNGLEILDLALAITPNVAFMVPRNTDPLQVLAHCGGVGGKFEAEKNILNGKVKTQTFYFGNLKTCQKKPNGLENAQ